MRQAAIGVDVGSGSARAAVFSLDGTMLGQASRPITTWRPEPGFAQQSSADVWAAVVSAVRDALGIAGPVQAVGIGFDATCSLVAIDAEGVPVSVSPDGAPEQDVIVWMDHRAQDQADRINAGQHDVLRYVGGRISLEMEVPKLMWLRETLPESWAKAAHFFDLPDFLTWKATGSLSRSLCSTVCKWTYLGHEGRWDEAFFRAIGLGEIADEGFRRIGVEVLPMGTPVGAGLSAAAAAAFGLAPGTKVGASTIDAHAGGIGVIGADLGTGVPDDVALLSRLALIGGTSSCHMAVSTEPAFVPGVWGPYYAAMVPGLWLNEGGQSATGSLVDHVIRTHAAFAEANGDAQARGCTIYERLNDRLAELAAPLAFPALLTADFHVQPDFHGNRSPRADATLRGMVSGLSLSASLDDLALLYLATVQAVAYGTRHIIETMREGGYAIDTILACGGGTKNPVFLREHADATGCSVVLPREPEAVLLGAAVLGAVAGEAYAGVRAAMAAMSAAGTLIPPGTVAVRAYHEAKYAVFLRMHQDQLAYRDLIAMR